MLTLSEAQWRELQARDAHQFVAAVADEFLSKRADMLRHPGRETVIGRMQAANDYALRVGFVSMPHIVRLMYLYADAPRVHDDRLIVQLRWYFMEPMSYRYFSKIFSTAKLRIETVFQP